MSYALIAKAIEPGSLSAKQLAKIDVQLAAGQYVLQPKYDGVNAVLDVARDGNDRAFTLLRTRTGELVPSCSHIELAALELPPGRYFGELWNKDRKHTEINGAARQHAPAPWLHFICFDYINTVAVNTGGTSRRYSARLLDVEGIMFGDGVICSTADWPVSGSMSLATLIESTPAMLHNLRRRRPGVYDGLILRLTEAGLKLGSGGSDGAIIKLKPRASADLLCVGTFPGKGKYEGMLGGLIVSLDGTPTGPTCEVGTGLSDEQRVREKHNWAGNIVEVEYLELTAKGKLREPAFKSIRIDKHQPDNLLELP